MADAQGVPGLRGRRGGEPPPAPEDELVGVLLQVPKAVVNCRLAGGGCEPQGGEGLAHELALSELHAASATVRHGARLEAVRGGPGLSDVICPRLGGAGFISQDHAVPFVRQAIVLTGRDVIRAHEAALAQGACCGGVCGEVEVSLAPQQEHHRLGDVHTVIAHRLEPV